MALPIRYKYKHCVVPGCSNTTAITPNKLFFLVPKDTTMRSLWCEAMGRVEISARTIRFVCQDHFDLKNDTLNWEQYTKTRNPEHINLKSEAVPHRHGCRVGSKKVKNVKIASKESGAASEKICFTESRENTANNSISQDVEYIEETQIRHELPANNIVTNDEICRLCFKMTNKISGLSLKKDRDKSDKLQTFFPDVNLDVFEDAIICKSCSISLDVSSKFKQTVKNTENLVDSEIKKQKLDKINLKKLLHKQKTKELENDFNICRTCFTVCNEPIIYLYENSANVVSYSCIKEMCLSVLQLEYENTENPVMCNECWKCLQTAYSFQKSSQRTEDKILKYCKKYNLTMLANSDLTKIRNEFTHTELSYSDDENLKIEYNDIKQESGYIEPDSSTCSKRIKLEHDYTNDDFGVTVKDEPQSTDNSSETTETCMSIKDEFDDAELSKLEDIMICKPEDDTVMVLSNDMKTEKMESAVVQPDTCTKCLSSMKFGNGQFISTDNSRSVLKSNIRKSLAHQDDKVKFCLNLTVNDFGSPDKIKNNLEIIQTTTFGQSNQIKLLQSHIRNMQNRIINLTELLEELVDLNLVSSQAKLAIENHFFLAENAMTSSDS